MRAARSFESNTRPRARLPVVDCSGSEASSGTSTRPRARDELRKPRTTGDLALGLGAGVGLSSPADRKGLGESWMEPSVERNEVNAKIAHEERHKASLGASAPVITFAVEALKSAILINGGTAGALLAFVGQKGIQAQPGLGEAFYWFAGGLLLGAFATAFSYFAQFCYACAVRSFQCVWEWPYVKDTPAHARWNGVGIAFHVLGILAVAGSFGAAVAGFWKAGKAMPF